MFALPLLAVTLVATSPEANDAANAMDLRCVAVIALRAAELGEDESGKIAPAFMYYIGKIDARAPGYDIEGALLRLLSTERAIETLQSDAPRCASEMERRGKEISVIGEALQRAGTETEADPAD